MVIKETDAGTIMKRPSQATVLLGLYTLRIRCRWCPGVFITNQIGLLVINESFY